MKEQKYAFLYALIITLIVFNLGIFLGYMLESDRIDKIQEMAFETELLILDQKAQSNAINIINPDCELLVKENIKFGDKIFEEAKKIGSFEEASQLNQDIIKEHKRFDLLRVLFWLNSIEIKNKCDSEHKNVVYIYQFQNLEIEQKAKQRFFSRVLEELKQKYRNQIMLIPIAGDINASSIELMKEKYNITELPSILVDEKHIITEIKSMEDIEKYLN